MRAGLTAFREAYLSAGADSGDERQYSSVEARRLRYALYWAFYENTAYRNINRWSPKFRADYGLYRYIRGIHNPAFRLGEFYATHLMGGALDPAAGDGQTVPSALPILTDTQALRPALAQLWRWSNWQAQKEIWTRNGAILGDTALLVVDDPVRQKVYMRPLHPGSLRDVVVDCWGNVKGYVLEEERDDPRHPTARLTIRPSAQQRRVTYTEIATRDGDDVVFQTFLDGTPYNWSDDPSAPPEWSEPYGFVPLVLTQHLNVGLEWGLSELYAGLGKFREVDDIASKLSDQIRKAVDAPWLFAGVDNPKTTPRTSQSDPTTQRPEPGREEIPALYAKDSNAKAHALVGPLDIAAVSGRIDKILAEIERDYPELQMDIWTASGDASGRALRVARQRVTGKVLMRRGGYDDGVIRAQQMAVAIGGHRGYEGFAGFGLDSYASGALDHSIGSRPVFEPDPLDQTEEDTAFWTAAETAKKAGYTLELYLEDKGWDATRIKKLMDSPERQARAALIALGGQQGQQETT